MHVNIHAYGVILYYVYMSVSSIWVSMCVHVSNYLNYIMTIKLVKNYMKIILVLLKIKYYLRIEQIKLFETTKNKIK